MDDFYLLHYKNLLASIFAREDFWPEKAYFLHFELRHMGAPDAGPYTDSVFPR